MTTVGLTFNNTITKDYFEPLSPENVTSDGECYWVVLTGNSLVMPVSEEQSLFYGIEPPVEIDKYMPLVIGLWLDKPLKVIRIDKDATLPDSLRVLPFQGANIELDDVYASIAGRAAQILHWERRSIFCSHCGGLMERIAGGWGKRCKFCGDEHFPHIHPCIIVLVRRGDNLLLIRNTAWDKGRFSLVAGFLDFGESLEECVCREVYEETGIEIKNINYVGSQCWPFPSQLMVGFIAEYAGGDARPDGIEVAEAEWFHVNSLPGSPGGRRSIARWIMNTYGKILDPK